MRAMPLLIKPNNVEPFDISEVRCINPRNYTSMPFPVTTFVYEEKGQLKAWTGLSINALAQRACIFARYLKDKGSPVFAGYISPMNLLRLSLYDMTKNDINMLCDSVEAVQDMALDLARACAKNQKTVDKALAERARDEELMKRLNAPNFYDQLSHSAQPAEQRDICDLVYPNRNGYQGD